MNVQEIYAPRYCAPGTGPFIIAGNTTKQAQFGGFLCTIGGTATIKQETDGSGPIIVNTFAITAGVFYPIPMAVSVACALILSAPAEVTMFLNHGQS